MSRRRQNGLSRGFVVVPVVVNSSRPLAVDAIREAEPKFLSPLHICECRAWSFALASSATQPILPAKGKLDEMSVSCHDEKWGGVECWAPEATRPSRPVLSPAHIDRLSLGMHASGPRCLVQICFVHADR